MGENMPDLRYLPVCMRNLPMIVNLTGEDLILMYGFGGFRLWLVDPLLLDDILWGEDMGEGCYSLLLGDKKEQQEVRVTTSLRWYT